MAYELVHHLVAVARTHSRDVAVDGIGAELGWVAGHKVNANDLIRTWAATELLPMIRLAIVSALVLAPVPAPSGTSSPQKASESSSLPKVEKHTPAGTQQQGGMQPQGAGSTPVESMEDSAAAGDAGVFSSAGGAVVSLGLSLVLSDSGSQFLTSGMFGTI